MKSDKRSKDLKKICNLKSINHAMMWYFLLSAFLLIFLVQFVFYIILNSTLEANVRERIVSVGKEIEMEAKFPMSLEAGIKRNRRDGFVIIVVNENWEVIAPADYDDSIDVRSEIEHRIVNNGQIGFSEVYRSGQSINYLSQINFGGKPHFILVKYSLEFVNGAMSKMILYMLLVGIIVFLATLLVSLAFSKKLTSGLKTISDTAVRLGRGDYSIEFTNADYKELAQLSDTLNYVRDEVKKSEDFQREILANVTHDLKTPLTMIKAYASMIKEISGDNKEKREKHLQVIIDEADRLTGLVNDVLSVSKLQSNIAEINTKVFNLTELVYGIINKFGYLQESGGYSLMVDIESNLYTRADEEKISQVLYNLLGNAANYTGDDKTVYISLKSSLDGNRIRFSVKDTGKGISKEDLPEIWNRYYRVKENHTRPVKGTGLGLSIVKAILENHAFNYGVESEVGKGSTFWIDFPTVPAEIEIE